MTRPLIDQLENPSADCHDVGGCMVMMREAAAELRRLQRIAAKADRLYDAIRTAQQLRLPLPVWLTAAADSYDLHTESTSTSPACQRCDTLLHTAQGNGFVGDNTEEAIAWAVRQMTEAHRLRRASRAGDSHD